MLRNLGLHEKNKNKQNRKTLNARQKHENDTLCTQSPLGFLPLGCLKQNGHVTHVKYLGKTKQV